MNIRNAPTRHPAFTLVELLVVIAIVGILVAILFPAINSVREAARRSQCSNNLRQIGIATLVHVDTFNAYPSGGWGAAWVGSPEMGHGQNQPGGWIYNLLPFLEQEALHEMGSGSSEAERLNANAQRVQTPIGVFTCPTRRSAQAWPIFGAGAHIRNANNAATVDQVARSCYAINAGSFVGNLPIFGPDSVEDAQDYNWEDTRDYNGVSYLRSSVREKQLMDGKSKTLLAAEKYLYKDYYQNGIDSGDNESMYAGYSIDLNRYATTDILPMSDQVRDNLGLTLRFGSSHSVWNAVFCDGSVRGLTFQIDALLHEAQANRKNRSMVP